MWGRLYGVQLWRHSRLGALVALGLVIGHLGVYLSEMQVFPFYLYAMYSPPNREDSARIYTVYQVRLNGQDKLSFGSWPNERYTYLYNQLSHYGQTVRRGYQSPSAPIIQRYGRYYVPAWQIERWQALYRPDRSELHAHYEAWLKRYLSSYWPQPIEQVEVWALFYRWPEGQEPELIDQSPLKSL